MVRYYLNLLNVDQTHPGVKQILAGGALSIRRTNKTFPRTAVDLTFEQTINADAASRLTGIAAFSYSDPARRRWMLTRGARSGIVGGLFEKAGLKTAEYVSKSLRPHIIKKDNEDLKKIMDGISNTMNPFTQEPDENLYCIATGKQVRSDIRYDLLHCVEKGETWCEEFTAGCFKDWSRFEKPIPRRKINNFALGAVTSKITCKDKKVLELQGTRDLLGRLLYISTVKTLHLSKVFTYPLVPVPLSLAHVDGTINKTDKAKLMHKLEEFNKGTPPKSVDVTLVDAMFMLHILQNIPQTFGAISSMILHQLCAMSPRVDFVCDTYITPSIKELEHTRRGSEEELSFSVTGADQKRPKDWQHALNSPSFKTAFFRFLSVDWQNESHADVLRHHEVYLAVEDKCYRFTEMNGLVNREDVPQLKCQHEEADTRLIYHLINAHKEKPDVSYSVRSSDTDVLVLLLFHVSQSTIKPIVWMDAGLSGNNTRRYINVTQLTENMESTFVNALPGFHAFSGSDYTASFMNKGKVKPLDLLQKQEAFCEAFAQLGEKDSVNEDVVLSLEAFVCTMYGKQK